MLRRRAKSLAPAGNQTPAIQPIAHAMLAVNKEIINLTLY
jgi:hypothetical protein